MTLEFKEFEDMFSKNAMFWLAESEREMFNKLEEIVNEN